MDQNCDNDQLPEVLNCQEACIAVDAEHSVRLKGGEEKRKQPDAKQGSARTVGARKQKRDDIAADDEEENDHRKENQCQFSRRLMPDLKDRIMPAFFQSFSHLNHHHAAHRPCQDIEQRNLHAADSISCECGRIEVQRDHVLMEIDLQNL